MMSGHFQNGSLWPPLRNTSGLGRTDLRSRDLSGVRSLSGHVRSMSANQVFGTVRPHHAQARDTAVRKTVAYSARVVTTREDSALEQPTLRFAGDCSHARKLLHQ